MKFGFSIVLLFFAVFAFPSFAEEVPAPKESLSCELGYDALYDRARNELGLGGQMRGGFNDQMEIFQRPDLAYEFTLPLHPAHPAMFRYEGYSTPNKPGLQYRIAGCHYGDKAAFEKLLHEIELREQMRQTFSGPAEKF